MSPEQEAAQEVSRLYQQQHYAELETAARRWLEQFPRSGFLWKALGVACAALGKDEDALDAKQRAVDLSPQDPEARANLVNELRKAASNHSQAGRYQEAAQCRRRLCAGASDVAGLLRDDGHRADRLAAVG